MVENGEVLGGDNYSVNNVKIDLYYSASKSYNESSFNIIFKNDGNELAMIPGYIRMIDENNFQIIMSPGDGKIPDRRLFDNAPALIQLYTRQ